MNTRRTRFHSLALGLLATLVSCAGPRAREPLVVFAASSLTDVMPALEASFEADHPRVDVRVSLAGTQTLRLQIEQGAPADVVLAADPDPITALASAGLVQPHGDFATNRLALIVPAGSAISRFDHLLKAERIVVGAATVPLGRYTERALSQVYSGRDPAFREHIEAHIVSREASARQVRAKVVLGEADAAIVYVTDARDTEGIRVINLPPEMAALVHYPAATVTASTRAELAAQFVTHTKGLTGRDLLADHGFGPP